MTATHVELDGRRLRREQNREAVLDALVRLFREGHYQPNAAEVAERAGISLRSLFRYFDDADDLVRAAIERQLAALAPLLEADGRATAPTAEKIERIVAARVELYAATGATMLAARAFAHRLPAVATQVEEIRSLLRRRIRALFAPELARNSLALPALDALLSVETYDLLRTGHRLSRRQTERHLIDALTRLLA